MTRRERMLAAVRHEPVDRVPFSTYNLYPDSPDHANDPSYAPLLDLVRRKAGVYCKCGLRGKDASLWPTTEATERAADGHVVRTRVIPTPKGDLGSVSVQPPGQPAYTTEHFIKSDEDIERCLSLPLEPSQYDASPAAAMLHTVGEAGLVLVGFSDPMYTAAALFDFNDFAVRCVTDIAPVKRLIDWLFERIQDDTRRLLDACEGLGVGFLTSGPELCTPPMMPPRLFGELVTPYQKRLIGMIHGAGFFAGVHCHGRVRDVFDEIVKTGADFLEPIEPPPQGDIALADLREKAEGRLCLVGHIQDQDLHRAPKGAMTKRVEEIARVVEGGTGYIMAPTCTPFLHPATDTYTRNYEEWIEAADRLL